MADEPHVHARGVLGLHKRLLRLSPAALIMNALVLVVVLVLWSPLVCVETAERLKCYQCLKASNNTDCKPATCSAREIMCLSFQVDVRIGPTDTTEITKKCVSACDMASLPALSSHPLDLVVSIKAKCCITSLCNRAASAGGGGLLLGLGLRLLQALQ
ncbi:lymphocyte antigen 6F [Trichechus manatus latirostris]|uniref:Lymphocyte antigen 6F n=1 Tax=Trichechus manatus latirostris TaxID=127582 RepID=A0A2Y9E5R9_TRIMA|nr:lymphocyte antigen 6F [Trichechus manatus latirostris]